MELRYQLSVTWQGNRGPGTTGHRAYDRDVLVQAAGKPDLLGSADPTFRGDASRWNPEELLLAALAQCHLLSYLYSAVRAGVVVTAYRDSPVGVLEQVGQGGRFISAVLRPEVVVAAANQVDTALRLHTEAGQNCFIAASVNFPITHQPTVSVATG
ncbi:OsmC family protein [Granulicoccus phenolivorans]|uniref:OsmC family protein n=1 Tax=Granulicoccus phenolivorans TaxID=266854 RepID=UPI0004246B37|nr:OsmC family protein [Granulicoccus phenolivorans]